MSWRGWVGVALVISGAVACAGGRGAPIPTATMTTTARSRWPTITQEELQRGRGLYVSDCSSCHHAPFVDRYSEATWAKIIPWMAKKNKLPRIDQIAIYRYVLAARASNLDGVLVAADAQHPSDPGTDTSRPEECARRPGTPLQK